MNEFIEPLRLADSTDFRASLARLLEANSFKLARLRQSLPALELNPMAPENSGWSHALTGGIQPEVTFGM